MNKGGLEPPLFLSCLFVRQLDVHLSRGPCNEYGWMFGAVEPNLSNNACGVCARPNVTRNWVSNIDPAPKS